MIQHSPRVVRQPSEVVTELSESVGSPTEDEARNHCSCLQDDDPNNLELPDDRHLFNNLDPTTCNDLKNLCIHVQRNLLLEGLATREVISPLERHVIEKHKDAVGKAVPPTPILNYLAWRRSSMFLMLVFGIFYLVVQVWTLLGTVQAQEYFVTWAGDGHISFSEYAKRYPPPEGGDFVSYSFHQLRSLIGSVLAAACMTAIVEEGFLLLATIGALFAVVCARIYWWRHSTSRKWIRVAWVTAFLAPMVISVLPTRNLIEYSAGEIGVVDGYIREVAEMMHLNDAQRTMLGTCDSVTAGLIKKDMTRVVDTIHGICAQVSNMALEFSVPCARGVCNVNLKSLEQSCQYFNGVISQGVHQDIHKTLQDLCEKVIALFPDGGPGTEFSKLLHYLESPLMGVLPAVETLSILICALHSLKCTLPSALIIAPGLLRGALRAKAILPMSSEPGMLALVTPWFFAAGLWSAYAVLFRFIRSLWLIAGLTLYAFGPMTIFAIGETQGLSRPMDDNNFTVSYRRMRRLSGAVYLFGSIFTTIGLIETIPPLIGHPPPAVKPAIRSLLCPQQFVSAFVGMFFLFGLTSTGATDWIIVEIAVQRRTWLEHAGLYQPFLDDDHDDDEHHIHELFRYSDESGDSRLDAFAHNFQGQRGMTLGYFPPHLESA